MSKYAAFLVQSKDGYEEFRNRIKHLSKEIRNNIVEVQRIQKGGVPDSSSSEAEKADIMMEVRLQSTNDLDTIQQAIRDFAQSIVTTDSYEYLGRKKASKEKSHDSSMLEDAIEKVVNMSSSTGTDTARVTTQILKSSTVTDAKTVDVEIK